MDDMVSQSVKALKETELVSCDGDETEERTTLRLTEYGEVMSKVSDPYNSRSDISLMTITIQYYVRQATVCTHTSSLHLRNASPNSNR